MSNVKIKTANEVTSERIAQIEQEVLEEAKARILHEYPLDAIPGRYESLSAGQRSALEAKGRQIAQAAKSLRDNVKIGGKPDVKADKNWPERSRPAPINPDRP